MNDLVATTRAGRRTRVIAMVAIFAVALGVRLLYATKAIAELYGVEQERYRIAHFYHEAAAGLAEGDDRVVFPSGVIPENTLLVGYPPGYFLVMAPIYAVTSNSMGAVLVVQCVVDALACVLLFLLGEAVASTLVGCVAGLLMALSPQFAYLSLVLKPDTLTVVPVLVAVLLLIEGMRSGRRAHWVWTGVSLGVACWLRQNALLLAPALAAVALLAGGWRGRLGSAAAMVAACVALVAPLTVRNLVVYGDPIPVTMGSGFALLSGLARDDYARTYGLSRFAYNVSVEEAARGGHDGDYYFNEYDVLQAAHTRKFETKHTVLSVFTVDGIERDHERSREARRLILSDPVYFATIYWVRLSRLMGYTQQNRAVPLDSGPAEHAFETRGFYEAIDPGRGTWRYYWRHGHLWDFVRPPLAALQRAFNTPLLLLAGLAGLALFFVRDWRRAAVLAVLPVYYLGLQSLMWAEFRHTLPVHLTVFVAIGVAVAGAVRLLGKARDRWRPSPDS